MVDRALRARQVSHESGDDEQNGAWNDSAADPGAPPEAALEDAEQRHDLMRRLDRLDDRERTILALRFGLGGGTPLTLKEVGKRLGVTREWVRKIEMRAVRKLEDNPDTPPTVRTPTKRSPRAAWSRPLKSA